MRPIQRNEILGLGEYEAIRPQFRARVIAEKKLRRTALGDRASALFENRDTVLMQIQEMLRTERITGEAAIAHEIETYNELMPGDAELSCTVMLEIDDKPERDTFLVAARGIEDRFTVVVDGERFAGKTTPERVLPDQASAILYLKFPLSEAAVRAIQDAAKGGEHAVELRVDHPVYSASVALPPPLLASVARDFAG